MYYVGRLKHFLVRRDWGRRSGVRPLSPSSRGCNDNRLRPSPDLVCRLHKPNIPESLRAYSIENIETVVAVCENLTLTPYTVTVIFRGQKVVDFATA